MGSKNLANVTNGQNGNVENVRPANGEGDATLPIPDRIVPEGHSGAGHDRKPGGRPNGRHHDRPDTVDPVAETIARLKERSREYGHPEDPARSAFPILWRWLCIAKDDRERSVNAGRISIIPGPQSFTVTLSHDDMGYGIKVVVQRLEDVFLALETVMKQPDAPFYELNRGKGYLARKERERKALDAKS